MLCPDCNEPLVVYELEGVEIDHCLECGGTWLDFGELELLGEIAGIHPGRITGALANPKTSGKCSRRCPKCRRRLDAVELPDADSIEIDRCRVGHGIWFDRGETAAVIAAFGPDGKESADADPEECAVARFFSNLYEDELKQDPATGK